MYVTLFKKSGNVLDSNPNDFENPPKSRRIFIVVKSLTFSPSVASEIGS